MHFLEWKCMALKISLKSVPNVRINNIPAVVQMMAGRRPSDKPWSEPMIVYWRIYASLGLNELSMGITIVRSCKTHGYKQCNTKREHEQISTHIFLRFKGAPHPNDIHADKMAIVALCHGMTESMWQAISKTSDTSINHTVFVSCKFRVSYITHGVNDMTFILNRSRLALYSWLLWINHDRNGWFKLRDNVSCVAARIPESDNNMVVSTRHIWTNCHC